ADVWRFEQVIINLCTNARDVMPNGGTLTLRTSVEGDRWVRIDVEDTGPGIPADVLPHIFEPFYTTKGAGQGTGLGLAGAFSFAAQSGGSISAENRGEGGARFTMRVPLAYRERPGDVPLATA